MEMGRSHWDIGVIGTFLVSICTTVIIVRDKILWYYLYYNLRSYMESYIE